MATQAVPKKEEIPLDAAAMGKKFGVGTVFGACVGVASKKLAKDAMYGAGLAVIGLQGLAYLGYIDIKWGAVEKDVIKALDQDGDGKLTAADAQHFMKRFFKVMTRGMPDAAGFVTGFYAGIKLF